MNKILIELICFNHSESKIKYFSASINNILLIQQNIKIIIGNASHDSYFSELHWIL
jgi:hypothetical protein